ncbi:glycosyl hydrolase family 76-domain-containing protein [Powellomyces hirtus]|nr:glycosyl hydrolase family 76-domain-containing protein [Powellomyces hirtus]
MLFRKALSGVLIASALGSSSAATLDPNDKAALGAAAHQATANLVGLYNAEEKAGLTAEGSFDQSKFSWFASGIVWGQVLSNSLVFGDKSQDATASKAIGVATFGIGDLLGGSMRSFSEKYRGKWNDDLGWWAFAMMTAVDAYGKDAQIAGGAKFLDAATLTFNQMHEQYDMTCGGGIYWSRNREAEKDADYKSTISNTQFVQLGARLAVATGNQTFLDLASQTYNWLKTSGLLTADWKVVDGVHTTTCGVVNPRAWGYNAGVMLGAAAYMYKATQQQSYLDDAKNILNVAVASFTQNNVVYEPGCPYGQCGRETPMGKPQLIKGMAQLYTVSNDPAVKAQIQTVIDTTLASAVKNCDADWWCSSEWTGTMAPTKEAYDQAGTAELLVAAAMVHGATPPAGTTAGGLGSAAPTSSGPAGSSGSSGSTAASPKVNSASASNAGILGTFIGALMGGLVGW